MKEHIYSVIASYRRKLGMSQQELAARAGLRREKVNRVESKREDIGLEELSRLLDAVGLELYVREKGKSHSADQSDMRRPKAESSSSHPKRYLAPQDFDEASFIDGSKAKILSWGKIPK